MRATEAATAKSYGPKKTRTPRAPRQADHGDHAGHGIEAEHASPTGFEPRAGALPRVEVSSLSVADRKALAKLWVPFGKKMIPMHEAWHSVNGSGGTLGPGSGEKFMQFHANLMNDFVKLLKAKPNAGLFARLNGQLPTWNTSTDLPVELRYPGMKATHLDWTVPGYLTAAGGGQPFELNDVPGKPARRIASLEDIKSPDELGRVLGRSGVHAVGHIQLGGIMAGFSSVSVAPFMLWHGKMEELRADWLATASGKAWLKKHPSGWTDPKANAHDAAGGHGGHDHGAHRAKAGVPRFTEKQVIDELARLARQQAQ
jgi:hypothetical protein